MFAHQKEGSQVKAIGQTCLGLTIISEISGEFYFFAKTAYAKFFANETLTKWRDHCVIY